MAQYLAQVKPSADQSREVAHLVGQQVQILPETKKWIDSIKDFQYRVIPVEAKGAHLNTDVRLCSQHMKPLDEKATLILNAKPPEST